jgi:hypothetical protein
MKIADIPIEISSTYSKAKLNDRLLILASETSDEPFIIDVEGTARAVTGEIDFQWGRRPEIVFTLKDVGPFQGLMFPMEMCFAKSPKWNQVELHCRRQQVHFGRTGYFRDFSGEVVGHLHVGNNQRIASLVLHLINFPRTDGDPVRSADGQRPWHSSRFSLTDEEWEITVDCLNDEDRFRTLANTGGFGITHTIKVQKTDRSAFSWKNYSKLHEDLYYFFSFARGFWTEPTIAIGQRSDRTTAWTRWWRPQVERWRAVSSWFDPSSPDVLGPLWKSFRKKLASDVSGEALKQAIYWYLSCNNASRGIEGSLIIAQAAHELLAWTRFATERGLSERGFENLPASDKLRLLLHEANIPLGIPSSLQTLTKAANAKDLNWVDGPSAITEIRNLQVHPSPKNQRKSGVINDDCLLQANQLSLWYLEVLLLFFSGYEGNYRNRCLSEHWAGDTEPVPWKVSRV